jgi:hypothetical protein
MDTKALLYALIGFFLGGLVVSIAATIEREQKMDTMPESTMSRGL